MTNQFRPLRAEINLSHLRHNVSVLKKMAGSRTFFCPMVKANAYGHDEIAVAKTLIEEKVNALGVALYEEGVRLRKNKISKCDVLVFSPATTVSAFEAAGQFNLTPVISSFRELELCKKAKKKPKSVHIKFNTGMNRLGFEPEEAAAVADYFRKNAGSKLAGICTHFYSGEDLLVDGGSTQSQFVIFKKVVSRFKDFAVDLHCLNSSALVAEHCSKNSPTFGSRPGLAIYGVKPDVQCLTKDQIQTYTKVDLKPVMSVTSEIILLHQLNVGDAVSYGARFVADKKSVVGVVPVGYADGFSRILSSIGEVIVHGQLTRVAGTVCMDFIMIDLTDLKPPQKGWVGAQVILLGSDKRVQIRATDIAEKIGTNAYEILTNFSARVPRVIV